MRPQLGSGPNTAALTSEEAETARATARAPASSAAPAADTSIRHVAPSPSHATDFARPWRARAGPWLRCRFMPAKALPPAVREMRCMRQRNMGLDTL